MITNDKPRGRLGWSQAVAKIMKMGRDMPADLLADLNDSIDIDAPVADGISANYVSRVPSRQEIPVSPTTSASGAGAEQLPKWSSDPATQSGITELYRRFSAMMEQFSELKKSQLAVIENLQEFIKAAKPFPDSEEDVADGTDEDEDSDEAQIEKALSGAGIRTGAIRDVIDAVRSHNANKMPPSFIKSTLNKADDEVDIESLNSEEFIRYQSARNALALAASGQKVHHDILRQAALTVANPSGSI